MHPLQGASFLSTPLQGGILKPPALRVVGDLLHRLYKESQHHRVRQRAHCILLSSQGINTTTLMTILSVDRITVYNWFEAWEAHHFVGLYDKKRPGRPPKLGCLNRPSAVDRFLDSSRQ